MRPALVVSNQAFHRYTRMAIVCPITNQIKDYPMHVKLDERTKPPAKSFVNMSSLSTLAARKAVFIESMPDDLLEEVLERIKLSIE